MEANEYIYLECWDKSWEVYRQPVGRPDDREFFAEVDTEDLARRIVAALKLTDHLSIEALESMKTLEVEECD